MKALGFILFLPLILLGFYIYLSLNPTMSANYFPEEIILQILHNLPIKSLVRCTCVCKSWNSLIRNPSFISTHLTYTKNHLLLFRLRFVTSQHYSLRVDNQQLAPYMLLGFPSECFCSCLRMIGSVNGVICIVNDLSVYNCSFFLWNPSIRKYLKLPKPSVPSGVSFARFGFDSKTNDYKVLRVVHYHSYKEQEDAFIEVELYSLNTNSWKSMTCVAPKYQFCVRTYDCDERDMHAFVNGVMHGIAYKTTGDGGFRNVVLGFDMNDEVFLKIKLPESLADLFPSHLSIMKYGDSSIAVLKKHPVQCDVWVMKEYGVVGSWTKLLSIKEPGGEMPKVLGFRKSGEVLWKTYSSGQIASLDPRNLEVKDLGVGEEAKYSLVDGYVESLVLLDNANAVSDTRYLGACLVNV